jgi:hypothetical protein
LMSNRSIQYNNKHETLVLKQAIETERNETKQNQTKQNRKQSRNQICHIWLSIFDRSSIKNWPLDNRSSIFNLQSSIFNIQDMNHWYEYQS